MLYYFTIVMLSGTTMFSGSYPTIAECRAGIVRETTPPSMLYEADNWDVAAASECFAVPEFVYGSGYAE